MTARRAAAATALLALSACAGLQPDYQKAGATRLSGAEVAALLGGRSISVTNPRGRSYVNSFAQDGTVSISGGKGTQTGRWAVVGDRYCLTLDADPREQCMAIYRVADGGYEMVNVDGTVRNSFKAP